MIRRLAVPIALFCACLLLLSCGKKEWPEPVQSEDSFTFKTVRAERKAGCLVVEVRVLGAVDNLAALTLQLMEVGEGKGCPGCPFTPTRAEEYIPGTPNLTRIGSAFRITACDLDPDGIYVWRVVGRNQFTNLGDVNSELFSSWPR
jgi:hypothetical protein